MELTPEEFDKLKAYLPEEFASDKRLEVYVEIAQLRVNKCLFGRAYIYALSLMVAHKLALLGRGAETGDAGRVTSKHEGDISISYGAAGSNDDGDLSSTSYGQEYLALLKQYAPRPGITGGIGIRFSDGNRI